MISTTRTQRRYDHRLRELVYKAKDVDLAVRYGVPRSTAHGWLAPTTTPIVTLNRTTVCSVICPFANPAAGLLCPRFGLVQSWLSFEQSHTLA